MHRVVYAYGSARPSCVNEFHKGEYNKTRASEKPDGVLHYDNDIAFARANTLGGKT